MPPPRTPTCHPDRKHFRSGLCRPCYDIKQGESKGKPGQIRCGFETLSGKPCQRWRDLDKQCNQTPQHDRTLDELQRIAEEHCALTGEALPFSMRDGNEPWDREGKREAWWAIFKQGDCLGSATAAARAVGALNPRWFGRDCRKFYQSQITEYLTEFGMGADETIARKTKTARNVAAKYLVPVNPDDPTDRRMRYDARAMVENGDGDQIEGVKFDKHGNPIYVIASASDAQSDMLDVHGLKKMNINLTNVSDEQLAAEFEALQAKFNAGNPNSP